MNNNVTAPVTKPSECDVLVIGGGPAGATAATLLSERGYQVTLLEKAHHPRFHIGESLLPANLPLLEKLGVAEAVRAIGMENGAPNLSPLCMIMSRRSSLPMRGINPCPCPFRFGALSLTKS